MSKGFYLCGFFLFACIALFGQKQEWIYPHKFYVKVNTADRKIKGRLYHLADSAIWVFPKNAKQKLPITIPVITIDKIDFRKNNHLVRSLLEGIIVGVLFATAAWVEGDIRNEMNFLQAGLMGGGLGIGIGVVFSFKSNYSYKIYRKQHVFENNRENLKPFIDPRLF